MSELNKLEQYIISKKNKIKISSKDIKVGDIIESYDVEKIAATV